MQPIINSNHHTSMKHVYIVSLLILLLTSCNSGERQARATAVQYISSLASKEGATLNNESVEVHEQPIPPFMSEAIRSLAAKQIVEDDIAKGRTSVFSRLTLENAKVNAPALMDSIRVKCAEWSDTDAYIATGVVNYTFLGRDSAAKCIVLIDKENPDSVIGHFVVNGNFKKLTKTILKASKGISFSKNEYGKLNTDSLTPLEKFIFE